MKAIKSDAELAKLHSAKKGFIYHDRFGRDPRGKEYNVLHLASCPWIGRSSYEGRIFFSDLNEATAWLIENRGECWRRCRECFIRLPSFRAELKAILDPMEKRHA
jgi:hypothetical protein